MHRPKLWIHQKLHYRETPLIFLFNKLPTHPDNHRSLINCCSHILINKPGLLNLGIELVIQHQFILYSTLPVFPGHRTNIEHIIRTQEWFAQCGITPLSLFPNQLRYNS